MTSLIRYNYAPGEIAALCKQEIARCDERISALIAGAKDFSAIELYDEILSDLSMSTEPARFMFYVHQDAAVRKEAEEAQQVIEKYFVELTSRRDLYRALVEARKGAAQTTSAQERLAEKILRGFRRSGLDLPDEQLHAVTGYFKRLSELDIQFHANLNNDQTVVLVTEEELEGVPESLGSRLERQGEFYKVTTRVSDVIPFMQNAKNPAARKRVATAYETRAPQNSALLAEAIEIRKKVKRLLGYKTWADYQAEVKMSKSADAVLGFLHDLRTKLVPRRDADLARLLEYKKTEHKGAAALDPWDVLYCENQIRKQEFALDDEELRAYFPSEFVVQQMLAIFSEVLGLSFVRSSEPTWAQGVLLYEIKDQSGSHIAYFYADFYPRDGKYSHAAAFTLRFGRRKGGEYITPLSAIVSNFTPPAAGKPSLLTHDEVVTLFHEFGHIMHQTLTQAPYGSLAGTHVAWDFVETFSQLFENWAWDPSMLKRISRHVETGESLPDALIDRMLAARDFNDGWVYTRQAFLALFDMELHTREEPLDPTQVYCRMYKEILALDPIAETQFPAGFGHLIGGYDAGYYGYLWSKVYAQDMFTRFEAAGVLNREAGSALRATLAAGDTADPQALLRAYLGREPSSDAFLRLLRVSA